MNLLTDEQKNIAIAAGIGQMVIGGIGFRFQHLLQGLPPTTKQIIGLIGTLALCGIAVYTTYKVFLKQQKISLGKTLLPTAIATIMVIFTSKLGKYLIPASQQKMQIATMTTTNGATQTITLNLTPIAIGLLIIGTATYLHKPTREKVWRWLTEG